MRHLPRWLALLLAAGCGDLKVMPVAAPPGASDAAATDGPGFSLQPTVDAKPAAPAEVGLGAGAEQCAEEAVGAQLIPLDLVLVLDASGSMNTMVDGRTKWARVQDALDAFVRDPRSAGLGVGLQVFPFTVEEKPCTRDAECGFGSAMEGYWCAKPHVCLVPGASLRLAHSCDPNDAFCPPGVKCVEVGRCSGNGERCVDQGQPCTGAGMGMCGPGGNVCKIPIDSCLPADYQQPRVPIGELPAAEAVLVAGLAAVRPAGGTPIAPAFDGAAMHLGAYVAAHTGHRAALVLATDGSPTGCEGNDEPGVEARLQAARAGATPLPTYVIGVLDAMDAMRIATMNRFATAGGTGTAFLLNAAGDLGAKFLAALDQIRASALPCELTIPKPSKGEIDFGRVNVRYLAPAGSDDLFYVGSADRCDPTRGGWYYDVPPAAGTPTRIRICDATCRRFQAQPGGQLQLRFGCRTRVIE